MKAGSVAYRRSHWKLLARWSTSVTSTSSHAVEGWQGFTGWFESAFVEVSARSVRFMVPTQVAGYSVSP